MGLSLIIAIMVLVANLVADIAYAAVDPRIKYD
jgi:peptide/nickel transport system permease protein